MFRLQFQLLCNGHKDTATAGPLWGIGKCIGCVAKWRDSKDFSSKIHKESGVILDGCFLRYGHIQLRIQHPQACLFIKSNTLVHSRSNKHWRVSFPFDKNESLPLPCRIYSSGPSQCLKFRFPGSISDLRRQSPTSNKIPRSLDALPRS